MAFLPLLDEAGAPLLDENGQPLLDEASDAAMAGAFSPLAFASVAFNTGVAVSGTVPPSVSVTVTVAPSFTVGVTQYVAGLGQVVSVGANPGGHPGQGLIVYPDTGELEVVDKYTPKVKSRARRNWR
jgi:hypothetical protein